MAAVIVVAAVERCSMTIAVFHSGNLRTDLAVSELEVLGQELDLNSTNQPQVLLPQVVLPLLACDDVYVLALASWARP